MVVRELPLVGQKYIDFVYSCHALTSYSIICSLKRWGAAEWHREKDDYYAVELQIKLVVLAYFRKWLIIHLRVTPSFLPRYG